MRILLLPLAFFGIAYAVAGWTGIVIALLILILAELSTR